MDENNNLDLNQQNNDEVSSVSAQEVNTEILADATEQNDVESYDEQAQVASFEQQAEGTAFETTQSEMQGVQPNSYAFDANSNVNNGNVIKKSGKKLIAIVAAVVLVLAIGCTTTWALAGKNIMQAVMGNAKYYAYIEAKNLKSNIDETVDTFDEVNTSSNKEVPETETDISLELGSALKQQDAMGIGSVISIFEDLGIKINTAENGVSINLSKKGENVLSIIGLQEDGKAYFQIPELSDKFVDASESNTSFSTQIDFNSADVKKDLSAIVDKALEKLDNVKIENDKQVKFGSDDVKVDVITVTVTEESLKQIVKTVAEELKNSDAIYKALSKNITKEEYKKALENAIKSIDESGKSSENNKAIYTLYVKDEKVIGRSVSASKASVSYQIYTTDSSRYAEFKVNTGSENSSFSATAVQNSKEKYVKFNVPGLNSDTYEYEIQTYTLDLNKVNIDEKGKTAKGEFTFTTPESINLIVNGKIDATEKEIKFELTPKLADAEYFTLKVNAKEVAKGTAKLPKLDKSKVVTQDEFSSDTNVMTNMLEVYEKLGLGSLMSLYGASTYDDSDLTSSYSYSDSDFSNAVSE